MKIEKKSSSTHSEHEEQTLEIPGLVVLETRPRIRNPGHGGAPGRTKPQAQNPLIFLEVVADASPFEPVLDLLFLLLLLALAVYLEQGLVQVAGPEYVGVDDPVDDPGRGFGSSRNEADDNDAVWKWWWGIWRRERGLAFGGG